MRFEKIHEQPFDYEQMLDSGNSVKRESSISNIQEIIDNNRYHFPKVASKFQILEFITPIGTNPFGNDDLELNEENIDNKVIANSGNCLINFKDRKEVDLINQVTSEVDQSLFHSKLYTREDGSIALDPPINCDFKKLLKGRSNSDSILPIKIKNFSNENILFENPDAQNKRIFKIEKNQFNRVLSNGNKDKILGETIIQYSDKNRITDYLSSKKNMESENDRLTKPRKYSTINYDINEFEGCQEDKKMKNSQNPFNNIQNNQNSNNFINFMDKNLNVKESDNLIINSNNLKEEEESGLVNFSKISREERRLKIQKYLTKKAKRNYNKRTRYKIRKIIAERRIRKNGKFICKTEEREFKKNSVKSTKSNRHKK